MSQSIEKAARDDVSRNNLQTHIEYFCSLGEKLAGSDEEIKACDYIVSRLAAGRHRGPGSRVRSLSSATPVLPG